MQSGSITSRKGKPQMKKSKNLLRTETSEKSFTKQKQTNEFQASMASFRQGT
jgi:hypothetical protein